MDSEGGLFTASARSSEFSWALWQFCTDEPRASSCGAMASIAPHRTPSSMNSSPSATALSGREGTMILGISVPAILPTAASATALACTALSRLAPSRLPRARHRAVGDRICPKVHVGGARGGAGEARDRDQGGPTFAGRQGRHPYRRARGLGRGLRRGVSPGRSASRLRSRRRLDDRPPFLYLGLLQGSQRFGRLLVGRKNLLTEIGETRAQAWIG
jgi:hypothetical protein